MHATQQFLKLDLLWQKTTTTYVIYQRFPAGELPTPTPTLFLFLCFFLFFSFFCLFLLFSFLLFSFSFLKGCVPWKNGRWGGKRGLGLGSGVGVHASGLGGEWAELRNLRLNIGLFSYVFCKNFRSLAISTWLRICDFSCKGCFKQFSNWWDRLMRPMVT